MYAAIRQAKLKPGTTEEVIKKTNDGAVPVITGRRGSRAYYLVLGDDGSVTTVSIFADKAAAEACNAKMLDWIKQNVGPHLDGSAQGHGRPRRDQPRPEEWPAGQALRRHEERSRPAPGLHLGPSLRLEVDDGEAAGRELARERLDKLGVARARKLDGELMQAGVVRHHHDVRHLAATLRKRLSRTEAGAR